MNCFYYTRYRFYNENAKHPISLFLIGDVHFSHKVSSKKLRAITAQARKNNPNYILITGDLIDSLDDFDNNSQRKRLASWLEQLGQVAPTFISFGNHDFYRKNPEHRNIFSRKRHWFSERNQQYIDTINSINNIQLLDNQSYEDKNIYIFGFTQSPEYYQFDRDDNYGSTLLHPGNEDLDIMLSDLASIDQQLISNLPKHKIKIALIHSPVHLNEPEVIAKLYEFDFFISGHTHSGVVPPIINDFWRSDRGLIAPGKKLFPHGARTIIRNPDDKSIILGAVSTVQASAKPVTFMNGIFPVNIATLELSRNEPLKRKPDVKHQYVGF